MSRRKFTFFVRHLRHHESCLTTGIVLAQERGAVAATKVREAEGMDGIYHRSARDSEKLGVPRRDGRLRMTRGRRTQLAN